MDWLKKLTTSSNNGSIVCILDIPDEFQDDIEHTVSNSKVITNSAELAKIEKAIKIEIPSVFSSVESRIQYCSDLAVEESFVDIGDELEFIVYSPILDEYVYADVTTTGSYIDTNIRRLFFDSKPRTETIQNTLSIALSLARTGQKGDPIGVLFVVGDEKSVLDKSRPLNHNPFSGADVHITDDVITASIGEFAKLDGAFVISELGELVSSNRYLEPRVHDADVPSGLGARHMAGSGITKSTDAVSIVVSETDQKVRCFVDGQIVLSIDPEKTFFEIL